MLKDLQKTEAKRKLVLFWIKILKYEKKALNVVHDKFFI